MSIEKLISDQLSVWPQLAAGYRILRNTPSKNILVGDFRITMQNNPLRIKSSTADISPEGLASRPCFLCEANRPAEQLSVPFEGRKGRKYAITLNPYPVFPDHLVISSLKHIPQSIWKRYVDMLDISDSLSGYTVFYNGPKCGASAPDHMHFQACRSGILPLEKDINTLLDSISGNLVQDKYKSDIDYISSVSDADIYHYKRFVRGVFVLRAMTAKSMAKAFYRLLDAAPVCEGEKEPRINLFTYRSKGEYRAFVIFRKQHQSHHYFSHDSDHLTISPGCVDMAGWLIVPDPDDYGKITSGMLEDLYSEVSVTKETEEDIIWKLVRTQPKISVGIMSGKEITFEIISDGAGPQSVSFKAGKIDYNGVLYDELFFEAKTMSTLFAEPTFILYGVTIGINFHWERKMTQKFAGALKFIVDGDKIVAINIIGVEDYLLSVISSEMKSSATLEFLKAHAVISRSWVMSQVSGHGDISASEQTGCKPSSENSGNSVPEHIEWFDHDDHKLFDVCADDHCQRYEGLTMIVGDTVRKAIDETWGQILMSGGEICDARFSKSCGGIMEEYSTCWGDTDYPYLCGKADTQEGDDPGHVLPDLTNESEARKWIESSPDSFCNTQDNEILGQVLNDYDLETKDFFRWKVRYDRKTLSTLISERCGKDIGSLLALVPLKRGVSGRLSKLEIIGTKYRLVIGKELIIRRYLSDSHLKSSAFVVDYYDAGGHLVPAGDVEAYAKAYNDNDFTQNHASDINFDYIVLTGAGWGHGVGLCQIGAAVMAYKGYGYRDILRHYYPGSELERR